MFKDILSPEQSKILPLLEVFSSDFYLAGGTAIALQLGHRKSIDFDLFSPKDIRNTSIMNTLIKHGYYPDRTLIDIKGQELTCIIQGIKITFLTYPFDIKVLNTFENINIPDLTTLGAMKCYTLGRRGKWKDYVDIYTLLNAGFSLTQLSERAKEIFGGAFNEKLLREQLCYFDDIDYTEEVEYIGPHIEQQIIQKYLIEQAISVG